MTTLNGIVEKKLSKGTYVSMFDSTMVTNNPPEPRLPKDWTTASFMDLDDVRASAVLLTRLMGPIVVSWRLPVN